MNKPKKNQPKTPDEIQERDSFQTPKYATKLLLPFIDKRFARPLTIWECAVGDGRIQRVLLQHYECFGTDLLEGVNFLTDDAPADFDMIVTNPPFSLKEEFYEKCMEYGKPFALLIPADNSIWIWDAVHVHGCEKILPKRRIDYLTPNILDIVCRGETFIRLPVSTRKNKYKNKPSKFPKRLWNMDFMYPSIDECPNDLLAKWSTSQFHSMWLTWGLGLGDKEIGVDLTNEMKKDI